LATTAALSAAKAGEARVRARMGRMSFIFMFER
jgi:hypothetical protein